MPAEKDQSQVAMLNACKSQDQGRHNWIIPFRLSWSYLTQHLMISCLCITIGEREAHHTHRNPTESSAAVGDLLLFYKSG